MGPTGTTTLPTPIAEHAALGAAADAGLRYVSGYEPGIRRAGPAGHFQYVDPNGNAIADPDTLIRIHALAIPPAWTDVWIATDSLAHIQATGKDAKGRKQYLYHALWRAVRDEAKFERVIPFGQSLPRIRERTKHDLARQGLPEEKMLAVVVGLLESTLIRVGDDEYVRRNQSFGLTTMLREHVELTGARIRFQFRGKSGKHHDIELVNKRLAAVIKRSQHLPGERLFEYADAHGHFRPVESTDVNRYLHQLTGRKLTAKDFRTWGGTLIAATTLRDAGVAASLTQSRRNVLHAIDTAAGKLGNTRSVARQSYIHPAIVDAYLQGILVDKMTLPRNALGSENAELQLDEARLLVLLKSSAPVPV
jgi:DNA topoisomerase I